MRVSSVPPRSPAVLKTETIDIGWKISVSSYSNCGRYTRDFAQPRAKEWWRTAELVQSHIPLCRQGKYCTAGVSGIDLDLRFNGSGEILRHCTLDDTIVVEPGLRVIAFPTGWNWKDEEYVPSVPRLDGNNDSRDPAMQHVGNNCTPDIASVVCVTTTEDVQSQVEIQSGFT